MNLRHMLHGHSVYDKIERYIILGLVIGVLLAGAGIASTILVTKGAPTALALVGSFITFVFTVILVFFWVFRGDR